MTRPAEHPFAQRWNHNTHYFPLLRSHLPWSGARVLDIGCGEGTFCRYVAGADHVVTGVDVDSSVLPRSDPGVSYVATSVEALGLADESFDAVTMTMVLHHVDATRALREATRVLAPGGALLLLGFGKYGGLRDLRHELRDVVTHRRLSRAVTPWDPPTAKVEPAATWAETEAIVRRLLPGCSYRRLPLWRYLVTWRKPGTRTPRQSRA
ncbi:MAG: class I SAM-dependent methyltransferase [Nocardioides sp.]